MKLYYKAGACSLSPHIVLHELGLPFEREAVDLATKKLDGGADYLAVNPKGSVPALLLDDGQVLTEGGVIVQYLADLAPERNLAPRPGSPERYRLMEWLNFIASDLHKTFGIIFNTKMPDAAKAVAKEILAVRLAWPARTLASQPYLTGESFSVADAYLFTVLSWAPRVGLDLSPWPSLGAFVARMAARPAVKATLAAEGL